MKKIVVKIGTRVLTNKDGRLDEDLIQNFVEQISKILESKISVLIVTSGAIPDMMMTRSSLLQFRLV